MHPFVEELLGGEEVEWKTLKEVFHIKNGYTPSKRNPAYWTNGTIPWFRMEDIRANGKILNDSIQKVSIDGVKGKLFPANSIIMSTTATIGEHALVTVDFLSNQRFSNFTLKNEYKALLDIKFVFYYFDIICDYSKTILNKSNFASVKMDELKEFEIPIPPLSAQYEIIDILDKLTELQKELQKELQLRGKQYEFYRNLLLNFKKK